MFKKADKIAWLRSLDENSLTRRYRQELSRILFVTLLSAFFLARLEPVGAGISLTLLTFLVLRSKITRRELVGRSKNSISRVT